MNSLCVFESLQKVQFYDCDPMGVVWHGNYLRYLEVARGEFLDYIGYGYQKIKEDGNFFPIVEERMKYLHSLRLGDSFKVKVYLTEFVNRLVHDFEIICNDTVFVKARTVQVCLPVNSKELSFFMPEGFVSAVEKKLNLKESL